MAFQGMGRPFPTLFTVSSIGAIGYSTWQYFKDPNQSANITSPISENDSGGVVSTVTVYATTYIIPTIPTATQTLVEVRNRPSMPRAMSSRPMRPQGPLAFPIHLIQTSNVLLPSSIMLWVIATFLFLSVVVKFWSPISGFLFPLSRHFLTNAFRRRATPARHDEEVHGVFHSDQNLPLLPANDQKPTCPLLPEEMEACSYTYTTLPLLHTQLVPPTPLQVDISKALIKSQEKSLKSSKKHIQELEIDNGRLRHEVAVARAFGSSRRKQKAVAKTRNRRRVNLQEHASLIVKNAIRTRRASAAIRRVMQRQINIINAEHSKTLSKERTTNESLKRQKQALILESSVMERNLRRQINDMRSGSVLLNKDREIRALKATQTNASRLEETHRLQTQSLSIRAKYLTERLESSRTRAETNVQEFQGKIQSLNTEMKNKEVEYAKSLAEKCQGDVHCGRHNEVHNLQQQLERAATDRDTLIQEKNLAIADKETQLRRARTQSELLSSELEQSNTELQGLKQGLASVKAELEELKAKLNLSWFEQQLDCPGGQTWIKDQYAKLVPVQNAREETGEATGSDDKGKGKASLGASYQPAETSNTSDNNLSFEENTMLHPTQSTPTTYETHEPGQHTVSANQQTGLSSYPDPSWGATFNNPEPEALGTTENVDFSQMGPIDFTTQSTLAPSLSYQPSLATMSVDNNVGVEVSPINFPTQFTPAPFMHHEPDPPTMSVDNSLGVEENPTIFHTQSLATSSENHEPRVPTVLANNDLGVEWSLMGFPTQFITAPFMQHEPVLPIMPAPQDTGASSNTDLTSGGMFNHPDSIDWEITGAEDFFQLPDQQRDAIMFNHSNNQIEEQNSASVVHLPTSVPLIQQENGLIDPQLSSSGVPLMEPSAAVQGAPDQVSQDTGSSMGQGGPGGDSNGDENLAVLPQQDITTVNAAASNLATAPPQSSPAAPNQQNPDEAGYGYEDDGSSKGQDGPGGDSNGDENLTVLPQEENITIRATGNKSATAPPRPSSAAPTQPNSDQVEEEVDDMSFANSILSFTKEDLEDPDSV